MLVNVFAKDVQLVSSVTGTSSSEILYASYPHVSSRCPSMSTELSAGEHSRWLEMGPPADMVCGRCHKAVTSPEADSRWWVKFQ